MLPLTIAVLIDKAFLLRFDKTEIMTEDLAGNLVTNHNFRSNHNPLGKII